jgi:hypothetical protein
LIFSVILELFMAVTSGLSVPRDLSDGVLRARSAWALSWPLALGLALFVGLANSGGALLGDPDSHWHIAVGNWILAHGTVPTVDSFSFTFAGQPWIAKEWLSQVLLALAMTRRLGGRRFRPAPSPSPRAADAPPVCDLADAAAFFTGAVVMSLPPCGAPHVLAFR